MPSLTFALGGAARALPPPSSPSSGGASGGSFRGAPPPPATSMGPPREAGTGREGGGFHSSSGVDAGDGRQDTLLQVLDAVGIQDFSAGLVRDVEDVRDALALRVDLREGDREPGVLERRGEPKQERAAIPGDDLDDRVIRRRAV